MKKKYIIFDFDGTLLDTSEIIIGSWNATAEKYLGRKLDRDEIIDTFGETILYTISQKFPGEDVQEVAGFYRDWQEVNCEGRVGLFPGVREMLDELKEKGHKLFLVTSRTKEGTQKYVDDFGLEKYFEAIVTPADCTEHKPSPQPLLIALEAVKDENPQPEDCIMVGDTKFDAGCANNAGIDGVLVEWGHPINEKLLEESGFKADYRIKSVEELMELVD